MKLSDYLPPMGCDSSSPLELWTLFLFALGSPARLAPNREPAPMIRRLTGAFVRAEEPKADLRRTTKFQ